MLVRWCHKITVFQIMFNYCSPPLKEEKACPHTRACVYYWFWDDCLLSADDIHSLICPAQLSSLFAEQLIG